jgi:hypothetical protein
MGRGWIVAGVFAGALAALLLALSVSSGGAASTSHRDRGPFAGLGTWVDIYSTEWADPEAAVTAMAQHGVRTLYLETGNYSHAAAVFRPDNAGRFIDAAHAAGIRVVAWYLPSFRSVKIDARKALGAIRFSSATKEHFDGFALDIEATNVRSLALRDRRLIALSSRIRYAVGSRYPLGAITPSPVGMSPSYWPEIPYQSLTHYYKAFLPMAYFTLRGIHSRAGARAFLTATVSDIRTASGQPRFPIHLIGGLSGSMGAKVTAGFVQAVADTKPLGYSLYAFGQTTPAAWRALARHR